jgi:hypothetical protein
MSAMSAQTDLSWDEWNANHKGANRNARNPRKKNGPHPLIVDGVKVHVHLIVPEKGGSFRTPDGNSWPSRASAVAHMTKTAKQRAAKRARSGSTQHPARRSAPSVAPAPKKARRLSRKAKTRLARETVQAHATANRANMRDLRLSNEIDLGRDGSKWKHGWIPLNAAAVALKAHHSKGGSGVSSPAEHMGKIREHVVSARKEAAASSHGDYTRDTPVHEGPLGSGHVRVTHSSSGSKYTVMTKSGETQHTSAEKAAVALHRHLYGAPKDNSEKTAWRSGTPASEPMVASPERKADFDSAFNRATSPALRKAFSDEGMARDIHGHGSAQHEAARAKRMAIEAEIKKTDPGYTTGTGRSPLTEGAKSIGDTAMIAKMHGKDSPEFKQHLVDNAEKMYGTGSKQHLAAKARFGGGSTSYPEHKDIAAAHSFLGSLKVGDEVTFFDGTKEHKVKVTKALHRRDGGGFGSNDHSAISVGYGPGRWNTEVTPANLMGLAGVKKKIRKG